MDPEEPSLLALELDDGTYRQTAAVTDIDTFKTGTPYEVGLTPSFLVTP